MTIEIVDFPMKNGGSFHSYVSLPEGRFGNGNMWCNDMCNMCNYIFNLTILYTTY